MQFDRDRGSVYKVIRVDQEFSWLGGKKKTRILSRTPLPINKRTDFPTSGNNGVEITRTGRKQLRVTEYWDDPEESHPYYSRTVAGVDINKDSVVRGKVRYIPETIAFTMKAAKSTAKQTMDAFRAEILEDDSY